MTTNRMGLNMGRKCGKHPEIELQVHPFKITASEPPKPCYYCPECEPSVKQFADGQKEQRNQSIGNSDVHKTHKIYISNSDLITTSGEQVMRYSEHNTPCDDNFMDLRAPLKESYIGPLDALRCAHASEDINGLLAYRKASKEPVADVVAWNKPGEERKCDIRWRRFDVAPGPLFAAPPIQAVTVPDEPTDDERLMEIEGVSVVKLPTEFHSEHGVVVQLEKVMAALAVHGIKYERWNQKVVGLRAGIDAVRAEGIDIDAEKINAEKCHK